QIVMRLGMRRLVRIGGVAVIVLAVIFLAFDAVSDPFLPLWAFLAWCLPTFLSFGLLFGNLNSLAMTPLGKLAGLGAAFVFPSMRCGV
ncbi:MAG: Bcr/CflA family drug resistance efflux transporter, partial [Gemmatimonadota bacterium]|nr:Bcr/CflA family drug resistance efflux transporter [Gemmatimonadota bacterium]